MAVTMITGGFGYLGRHLVSLFADRGEHVVSFNRDYGEHDQTRVTPVQGELYDIPRLVDTFRTYSVGRVVHTAAMSHPDLSIDLPITTVTANVAGTVHLLEAARLAGVKRIVNLSSETVYGNHEGSIDESTPLHPTTPYGVTKVATEMLCQVYNDRYGFDAISLRVTEMYGPGNRMPQVLQEILKAVLASEPFRLQYGSDHRFNFVHVLDVAEAVFLAANCRGHARSVYNVAGRESVLLADAVSVIQGLVPEAEIEVGPGHTHLDRQGPWDISAAQRDLGYRPAWTLERGLRDYVTWLRENEY
jgi:nucleoside-diphosphate-sugar epimerase